MMALTFDLNGVHRDVWFSNMEHLQAVRQLLLALGSPAVHSHHQVVATFLPAKVALQADTHGPTQTDRQMHTCTHTHTRTHMQTHTQENKQRMSVENWRWSQIGRFLHTELTPLWRREHYTHL